MHEEKVQVFIFFFAKGRVLTETSFKSIYEGIAGLNVAITLSSREIFYKLCEGLKVVPKSLR